MSENIIESAIDNVTNTLDKYSEVRELLEENVLKNSIVEIIGDSSKVISGIVNAKRLKDKVMFAWFLKGFNIGEETEQVKIEKLKNYVDNEDKALFISDTLEKIMNSKSKLCALILGYMINTLTNNKNDLHPKYIILADALTHMFDHDIKNIKFLGDYCNYKIYDNRKKGKSKKRNVYFYKRFKELLDENNCDKDIMYLTLEKCMSYQLMRKNVESTTDLDLDGIGVSYDKDYDDEPEITTGTASANTEVDESYELTIIGDLLYEIICVLGIEG